MLSYTHLVVSYNIILLAEHRKVFASLPLRGRSLAYQPVCEMMELLGNPRFTNASIQHIIVVIALDIGGNSGVLAAVFIEQSDEIAEVEELQASHVDLEQEIVPKSVVIGVQHGFRRRGQFFGTLTRC